jgi:hypothetical protein
MNEELIQILTEARDRVANGWVQNNAQVDDKVCAGYAMVIGWRNLRGIPLDRPHFSADELYERMVSTMMSAIRELWPDERLCDIPTWNDRQGRTQTEVLDTFERALKIAERDG